MNEFEDKFKHLILNNKPVLHWPLMAYDYDSTNAQTRMISRLCFDTNNEMGERFTTDYILFIEDDMIYESFVSKTLVNFFIHDEITKQLYSFTHQDWKLTFLFGTTMYSRDIFSDIMMIRKLKYA